MGMLAHSIEIYIRLIVVSNNDKVKLQTGVQNKFNMMQNQVLAISFKHSQADRKGIMCFDVQNHCKLQDLEKSSSQKMIFERISLAIPF